jgi:NiFe hydrogenase small subunit HydA
MAIHGLECTCCSESFIRSGHPLAKDVILSMLSLDYDDTIMAAAGHEAEAIVSEIVEKYKGNYILAVEGNAPLGEDGMYCIIGGKPFVEQLRYAAENCKAIISWGSCASWGCVQAAKPNPTRATPTHKIPNLANKPIIKVPGCPPIAEVMTAVVTYLLTFDKLPTLDAQGRPQMFYSQRIHDKCYRRPHFDAGQFVESWDDDAHGKVIVYTKWVAKVRRLITLVQPCVGMKACRSRFNQVTVVWVVQKMVFGIKAVFTNVSPTLTNSVLKPTLTKSAALPQVLSQQVLLHTLALPLSNALKIKQGEQK